MATSTMSEKHHHFQADTASLAPSYATHDPHSRYSSDNNSYGYDDVNPPDADLSPPAYSTTLPQFHASIALHIDTAGKNINDFSCSAPNTIAIFSVPLRSGDGGGGAAAGGLSFTSHRPHPRKSNSCFLVAGNGGPDAPKLSSTTYRMGYGTKRHPKIRLFGSDATATTLSAPGTEVGGGSISSDEEAGAGDGARETFQVHPKGLITRAQEFSCGLGSFEWRYGTRKERKALEEGGVHGSVNSLLVLDRVVVVVGGGSGGSEMAREEKSGHSLSSIFHRSSSSKKEGSEGGETRVPVARLIRGNQTRAAGTGRWDEGNGGLLEVDVAAMSGEGGEKTATGVQRECAVVAVTTILLMLKKEVDNQRNNQIALVS